MLKAHQNIRLIKVLGKFIFAFSFLFVLLLAITKTPAHAWMNYVRMVGCANAYNQCLQGGDNSQTVNACVTYITMCTPPTN